MRILVFGRIGQVSWELRRTLLPLGEVTAVDRGEIDLGRPQDIGPLIREHAPDVIVNGAAYTAVDLAEKEAGIAHAINAAAPAAMAREAARAGALMIHYSTDYVFDGTKAEPYDESDETNPLGVYGASKLAGEREVESSGADYLTLRTSWVYAARGRNFVRTMLKLARERDELRVVADQVGAPTWARFIAEATAAIVRQAQDERLHGRFSSGTYHLTNGGSTSWHGFAESILSLARDVDPELPLKATRIVPIATADYPVAAKRPANSRLSCERLAARFDIEISDWRSSLELCIDEMLGREG